MSHDKVAATFDEWARAGQADSMEISHADPVEQVVARMGIRAGERILDLGCGNGWATRMLAKSAPGVQAIGVDVSPRMIERADELHSFTIRARYELGSFEALEFPDGHFDRAFSMEAIYYATDVQEAIDEVHRVLKPGGTFDAVIDFYRERPGVQDWPQKIGLAMVSLGEAEWRETFAAAGFEASTERVVDRRGPGDEAAFQPSAWSPDWPTKVAAHEAGSLWIRGVKPT